MNTSLLFVSHTAELSGGGERSLFAAVLSCHKRGYLCHVILPGDGDFSERLCAEGISNTVLTYPWSEYKADDGQDPDREEHVALHLANCMISFEKTIAAINPDVVITNTLVAPWGMYAAGALGIPNIVMIREWMFGDVPMKMAPENGRYIRLINAYADFLIFNSNDIRAKYRDFFPHIPSAVMYPDVGISEETIEAHYREISMDTGLSVMLAGAFVANKNQMEAVDGIARVMEKGVSIEKVLFVGKIADPDYYQALLEEIDSRGLSALIEVRDDFTEDFFEIMNQYNTVLVPSKSESFGRVVLEAQLFGRLVVSSRNGGAEELIEDGRTGLLYDLGDADGLAKALKHAFGNAGETAAIAKRAMELQRGSFVGIDTIAPLESAIEDAVCRRDNTDIERDRAFDPIFALLTKAENLQKEISDIRNSHAFKLGYTALTPLRKLKGSDNK